MIEKQILVPDRVRRLPTNDWSWIDRRFQREYASDYLCIAPCLYWLLKPFQGNMKPTRPVSHCTDGCLPQTE